ncbi:transglycosylase domain-containing protein [Aneurinibacillus tyrosinisolvens]|uniref:transglycosylase domain-containing protein n=1 Tax=Aneurinibacillus tyrosinisolvens TaxID=1443435 RepID=UPI00069A551E|nr:penicillin-binding protein 1A [Aneurinibacillus tyrosinisolvens]
MDNNMSRKTANQKKGRRKRGPWKLILLLSALFFLLTIGGCSALYMAGNQLIDENKLHAKQSSTVYDIKGNEIAKLSSEDRQNVTIDKIPKQVVEAFVATEDNRFYEHNGVDPISIGRAIVKDIVTRSKAEGASTITQQLARNIFLSNDKTFMRKTKEVMIALNLERKFSKDQIMEMYLNNFYAGHGVFGVQAASKYYFGKPVDQLSLSEGAVLAALPKAPNTYSPINNPDKSLERRNLVLSLMNKNGYISQQQVEQATKDKIKLADRSGKDKKSNKAAYQAYVDYVAQEAENELGIKGDELYLGGYKIYTYLDQDAQNAMFKKYQNDGNFPKNASDNKKVESAMVIMEAKTGGISAMVGGRDYVKGNLNLAKGRRQPGSTIKPLVDYTPALEQGWTPDTPVKDERTSYGKWTPKNFSGEGYLGSTTMRRALIDSRNAAAVWTLNQVGLKTGVSYLQKFGIPLTDADRSHLAIALGGMEYGVTPIQMAQAYSSFANEGQMNQAHAIKNITTADGSVVVEEKPNPAQVVSPQTAYYMTDMLQGVVSEGTGRAAQFGRPVAGKTGTHQYDPVPGSNKDVWFVGYTPDYVGAVWMGFDKTDKQHNIKSTGGAYPARMFAAVMSEALRNKEVKDFSVPRGIQRPQPPAASLPGISDLSATVDQSGSKVQINWSGNGDNRVSYRLYRFLGSPQNKQLITDSNATSFTDSFDPNQLYSYVVVPYNTDTQQEGSMSNIATTTVPNGQTQQNPNNPNPNPNGQNGQDPNNPNPNGQNGQDPNNPNLNGQNGQDPNNPNPNGQNGQDPNNSNPGNPDSNNPNPADSNGQNPATGGTDNTGGQTNGNTNRRNGGAANPGATQGTGTTNGGTTVPSGNGTTVNP